MPLAVVWAAQRSALAHETPIFNRFFEQDSADALIAGVRDLHRLGVNREEVDRWQSTRARVARPKRALLDDAPEIPTVVAVMSRAATTAVSAWPMAISMSDAGRYREAQPRHRRIRATPNVGNQAMHGVSGRIRRSSCAKRAASRVHSNGPNQGRAGEGLAQRQKVGVRPSRRGAHAAIRAAGHGGALDRVSVGSLTRLTPTLPRVAHPPQNSDADAEKQHY